MIGGLHHVGITVSDLDRSLAFYRGLLGLHIEARAVDVAAEDVTGIPGARVSIADLALTDSGPRWDGSRVVYTVDPDGVTVELVQAPPG